MSESSSETGLKYFGESHYLGDHLRETLVGEGENWEYSLAQAVMNLHNGIERQTVNLDKRPYEQEESLPDTGVPPKVIFVTATTAIAYAFAIRECWRTAYPDEHPPKFFFIDVSNNRFGEKRGSFEPILSEAEIEVVNIQQEKKLRQIGEKYSAFKNTAVFDEFRNTGETIRKCQGQFMHAGFSNVNFIVGNWGDPNLGRGMPENYRPVGRKGKQSYPPIPYQPLIVQNNEQSRNIISDMKTLGNLMGQQIILHSTAK